MPMIELEVSQRVHAQWQRFLDTQPAGRLTESGLLGDWVALAFMAQVESFLKHGLPAAAEDEKHQKKEQRAVEARKRLSKPQKRVLNMFNENENQTALEISRLLGISVSEGRSLTQTWVEEGFLAPGPQRGGESTYMLSPKWQKHNLAANRPSLNVPRTPHLLHTRNDA